MATLQEIRAKLQAMESNQTSTKPKFQGDNAMFPFWNIPEGATATMRFLPDGDPDNTFFWTERNIIRLEFPGVVGVSPVEQRKVTVQVPCGEIYGDTCPVLTEVRPWYKDDALKQQAGKYWKKRSYIFQGFVTSNPLDEEETPENPIRRFIIGPQIFQIIKSALMDPDMEHLPTDYVNGTDFRLTKSTKGDGHADYTTSSWARRERSLDETELAAIDQYGLHDLKEFMPARPTAEHYEVISQMFEASVDGELYDPERWGNFYKPYGIEVPATAAPAPGQTALQKTEAPVAKPAPAPVQEKVETPVADDTPPFDTDDTPAPAPAQPAAEGGKQSADDILNMIRNRQKEA